MGMTNRQRLDLLGVRELLERFRERCAAEADYEQRSAQRLGHWDGDMHARYAGEHIRQIDVAAWLATVDLEALTAALAEPDEPVEYATDPDTCAIYCKLRSGRVRVRYPNPVWGGGWHDASVSLMYPALKWRPVAAASADFLDGAATAAPAPALPPEKTPQD